MENNLFQQVDGGANPTPSLKFLVKKIPNNEAIPFIIKKHYAHRKCSISFAFGLFKENIIVGVCTFGYPPNQEFNDGACVFGNTIKINTMELNRLFLEDGLPKNTLSFFVSRALKMLPKPMCIVSYADPNFGHHGYIYQATNWIYTGVSTPKFKYTFSDGSSFDIRRGIDKKGVIVGKEKILPTHRYFKFKGSRASQLAGY